MATNPIRLVEPPIRKKPITLTQPPRYAPKQGGLDIPAGYEPFTESIPEGYEPFDPSKEERTLSGFIGNIPGSFMGLFEPLLHPIETSKGTVRTIAGVVEKMSGYDLGDVKYADAAGRALMDRYGSWEAVKKTLYEDPVGFTADVAGLVSGLGGVARGTASMAGRAGLRTGKLANIGRVAEVAGRTIDPTLAPVRGAALVTEGIARTPYLGRAVTVPANTVSEILGAVTGGGGETIRTAWNSPSPELAKAMRGGDDWLDVVKNAEGAMQDLRSLRQQQYVSKMKELFGTDKTIDLNPFRKEVSKILREDFRGKVIMKPDKNGIYRPHYDLSMSHIKTSPETVTNALQEIADWSDYTPAGVDTLKQRLSDAIIAAPEGSRAETFLTKVEKKLANHLERELPGYKDITAEYRRASEFLKMITQELSLKRGDNPGTVIRKLARALNEKTGYRASLIDAIDQYTPPNVKLREQIAGMTLKEAIPQSMIGRLAGGTVAGAVLTGTIPASGAALTVLSSPRIMGETIVALSKMYKAAHGLDWNSFPGATRGAYYGYQATHPVKVTPPPTQDEEPTYNTP